MKACNKGVSIPMHRNLDLTDKQLLVVPPKSDNNQNVDMMQNISDFIQGIRLEKHSEDNVVQATDPSSKIVPSAQDLAAAGGSQVQQPEQQGVVQVPELSEDELKLEEAKRVAEKLVVDAEKFKASVIPAKPGLPNFEVLFQQFLQH